MAVSLGNSQTYFSVAQNEHVSRKIVDKLTDSVARGLDSFFCARLHCLGYARKDQLIESFFCDFSFGTFRLVLQSAPFNPDLVA